jgi:hypothetical protein
VGGRGRGRQLGGVAAQLRSCSVFEHLQHHSLFLYVLTGMNMYVSVERGAAVRGAGRREGITPSSKGDAVT